MARTDLADLLQQRFDEPVAVPSDISPLLMTMAERGSCRAFADRTVDDDLLRTLCALALASPTKSDLQQRDIILLKSPTVRADIARLVAGQAWVAQAPMIAVFCGNNRRQRLLHDWRGREFVNDHLDAFFNASVDAGIALAAFVTAADAAGLGTCPISAVRNEAQAVSDLLDLPPHVFPVAGLAIGHPAQPPTIAKRLPLSVTLHIDRYGERGLQGAVEAYDARRAAVQPYARQRSPDAMGIDSDYGWSEDKARQYSLPERETFGAYVRARGFKLE